MEAMHAPWRIRYILQPKVKSGPGSLFERIDAANQDEEHHVIARGASCFAMLNAYPYAGGHLMVIPYRAVKELFELTPDEMLDLMNWVCRCQKALIQVMAPHGFNIGLNLGEVAGAGIAEHLHMHVVPRWNGDTNFMPVIAGTTVVPEALKETAKKLREALKDKEN